MKIKPPMPIIRAVVVAVIVGVIGWIGFDISPAVVEETVDAQLAAWEESEAADAQAPAGAASAAGRTATVVAVIDGDTARVNIDGRTETLRFIGIDTPETATSPAGLECYGDQATVRARALLAGQTIVLTADPTQDEYDQYDRLLVYAQLPSGIDFGQTMIEEGFAREYTFVAAYENQATYQTAQQTAQAAGRGLWSACLGDE